MKLRNLFKNKQQWLIVHGYVFKRSLLEKVTTIERVQKDIDEIAGITVHTWEFWVHFEHTSSQHLTFSTELEAVTAHSDICAFVQEVQS